jgi:hypothetical protein
MLKHITAVALLGLALAAPVAAQTTGQAPANPINPKLMQQRIRAGVRSGQISREELAAIRQHLQSFRQQLQAARANGELTPEQRRAFRQQWRQISREVYRARHNRVRG